MTNEQKAGLYDVVLRYFEQFKERDDSIPIMVGVLNRTLGINGFHEAEPGHPVFEFKDRYIIYLESKTPMLISQEGKPKKLEEYSIAVPYFKETLKSSITFHTNQS
jgi:hypothetical protein